jgi:hypothetical protein
VKSVPLNGWATLVKYSSKTFSICAEPGGPAGEPVAALPQEHENLRGATYYGGEERPC